MVVSNKNAQSSEETLTRCFLDRKVLRSAIKLLFRQVRIELFMAVDLPFCSWAVQFKSKPSSQTRPLNRILNSSPNPALLGLGFKDAQRGAAQQPVDAESRAVVLSGPASPKKSPPPGARFTHRGLTTNNGMNLQPLSIHHPMRSLFCQICNISVVVSPFQLVKGATRAESDNGYRTGLKMFDLFPALEV